MREYYINPKDAVVDQPLLILTPRRWLFRRLGRVLAILFIAAFFSFNVFVYVSIPLYLMSAYFLYELSSVWRAHRYSTFMLYLIASVMVLVFLALGKPLRLGFYYLVDVIL
ncbi:MAG TPA: hypothetical protein GX019_04170 [Firmicutes bacterium]|jgi:hypothetical protein|nr:hypothetical protein [Bacillota bacterium]